MGDSEAARKAEERGGSRSPEDGTAGKLSDVPFSLPLSVTGSSAAMRPAQRRSSRSPLSLGIPCLVSALLTVAGSLAASAAPVISPTPPTGLTPPPAGIQPPQAPGVPTAATGTVPAPVISEAEFQELLRTAGLDRLDVLCRQLVEAGDDTRLRLLRDRLLTIHPAPQPLAVVLANAEVLLSCRMPDGALTVLDRIGPARGAEQVQWLTLQWRAANAAMDHRRAALALERLSAERPAQLENLLLPLQQRSDGTWTSRSALEVLASHLESAGQTTQAAGLLLLSRNQDAPAAERLAAAARLLAGLPVDQREPLFERALEQAAAAGAWGLVGDLLAAQASLPSSPEAAARTAERRLRLSRRLDDAYGEWRALVQTADPAGEERRQTLQRQLRSPQAPGGHAESLPAPAALPPLFSAGQSTPGASRPAAAPPAADAAPSATGPARRPSALPTSGPPVSSQP